MKLITILILMMFAALSIDAQIESTCVAKYSFDNGDATDDIGDNDGTVYGATLTSDRFGNSQQAFYFDGVDDYIDLGDPEEFRFGNGDFSISLWIKPDADAERSAVITKMNPNQLDNWNQYAFFYKNLYGTVNFNVFGDFSPNSDRALNTNVFNENNWNHIVLIHSIDSSLIYVNGNLESVGKEDLGESFFDVAGYPLTLGVRVIDQNFFYKGKIDDIHIYEQKLTSQEVIQLHNSEYIAKIEPFIINGDQVGIGTGSPRSRLEVEHGDIFVSSNHNGIILTDSLGGCWKVKVNSFGEIKSRSVVCPE